jgi:uncharacterized repeat protein (TIGR01451 family)
LFKTTNAGTSWAPIIAGLTNASVNAIAIHPSNSSILFAGTGGGIFKSTDGGANWTLSNSGITSSQIIHAIVIDAANPSTMYAAKASAGLVFKSTNGGQTWSNVSGGLVNFPTLASALAIDPSTPASVYVGLDSSGVFKSLSGGGNWQPTGQRADLTITSRHSDRFYKGLTGRYTLNVSNVGEDSTIGTVSVTDTLPPSLVAAGMFGAGWNCTLATITCTRSDALAPGVSYPWIVLTVRVASNAPPNLVNMATVGGGGDLNPGNNTAIDPTVVAQDKPEQLR